MPAGYWTPLRSTEHVADPRLAGVRVLVTRAPERAAALTVLLQALGASVTASSTIELVAPLDTTSLTRSLIEIERYDWVVFTSRAAVEAIEVRRAERGAGPLRARLAAVGPATARALEGAGLGRALVVADPPRVRGLLPLLRQSVAPGERVLVLQPEGDSSGLAAELRRGGAAVDEVVAYRNVPSSRVAEVAASLVSSAFDIVIFTAPSTLRRLLELDVPCSSALLAALAAIRVVAIGPTTAAALAAAGVPVAAVAATPAEADIVAAVLAARE